MYLNVITEFPLNEIFDCSAKYTAPPCCKAVLLLKVTLQLSWNVTAFLSNEYIAPPCCIAVLLVNTTEQFSRKVILLLITEDIAPPCCLARLPLKYIVDPPVNRISQLSRDEMAPPLNKAVLLQNLTTAYSKNVIQEVECTAPPCVALLPTNVTMVFP